MKNEIYLRVAVITSISWLIVYFSPKYDYLTNYTTKLLAILSYYIIGVVPGYYQNSIIFNFGVLTPMSVSPECSGLIAILVFLMVIWLVPNASLKSRIYAFALVPIIYFSNIFRLLVAVAIGNKFGVEPVTLYHATIGQLFTFVMLISCFIIFIKFSRNTAVFKKCIL